MTFRQKPSSFDLKSNAPTLNLYSTLHVLYSKSLDLSLLRYYLSLFSLHPSLLVVYILLYFPPVSDLLPLPRHD